MKAVFLTSAGVVCHTGRGLTALYQGLMSPSIQPQRRSIGEISPTVTVPYLPALFAADGNRAMALLEAAVADALAPFSAAQCRGMALFIASSTADLIGSEPDYAAAVSHGQPALAWRAPGVGLLAARVAQQFGLCGAQYTINTACSSGAHALLYAGAAIRRGDCERALVIGLECPGRVTLAGFNSLLLISPTQCRPFDRDRDGLLLGEAAAAVVLDAESAGPRFTGMQLSGAATASDSSSATQTSATAVQALIQAAMRNAGIDHVDTVKAHGTGTPGNDRAEAAGIAASMDTRHVPVTSVKPVLGHTLGACGVLETLAMAVCWREGYLPPTAGFRQPDPALGITPTTRAQALPPGRMLLNYLGFGGNNGALVLSYTP